MGGDVNRIQILGLVALCVAMSGSMLALVAALLGLSLFVAIALMYAAMFALMLGMQRRARESYEHQNRRHDGRLTPGHRVVPAAGTSNSDHRSGFDYGVKVLPTEFQYQR